MCGLKLLALILLLSGCAHADLGQFSDSATTAVALSSGGFVEANPLLAGASWPVISGVKLGATQVVKRMPPDVCEPGLTGLYFLL